MLLIGSAISFVLALVIQFFCMNLDYARTERVQFEDDEYYYYVKAVPKKMVATEEKVVKHFIFVIIQSIKEVQKASQEDKSCVGIEKLLFLLSNANFMEIINQKLLQKNIRCSEIQVAYDIE